MASRSRKRRPGAGPPGPAGAARPTPKAAPGPPDASADAAGSPVAAPRAEPTRAELRRAAAAASAVPGTGPTATPAPGSRAAKTEAKNAAVRAQLEPLRDGERPEWVTYAAIFATVLGLLNVVLYVAGVRVADGGALSAVIQGGILLVCAAGMWRAKYWAVMGFEVLMGVTTAFGALSLLVASSLKGAAIAVAVVLVCGTFFWKLIRAMARIQMPARPGARAN